MVGLVGPSLLRAWVGSLRIRWSGPGMIRPRPGGRENVIYVFWHQRLLPFPVTHRGLEVRALISAHGDGEMLSLLAEKLGHRPIRGSSTRGGSRAMRALLAEIGCGRDFVITPDGPRGPRHVFHPGAAYFASKSGLTVIPASAAYRSSWSLPSWDGFIIPRPFTRAVIHGGHPIRVPPDLDDAGIEDWRQRLEKALREVTEESDRRFEELYRNGLRTAEFRRLEPPFPWAASQEARSAGGGR